MMDLKLFKIPITLRRIAMISIAKTLWTLPSTLVSIRKIGPLRLNVIRTAERLPSFLAGNLDEDQYKNWEKVIEEVLQKTTSFSLPKELEVELWKIIIMTGKKLFIFNGFSMRFQRGKELRIPKHLYYIEFLETMGNYKLDSLSSKDFSEWSMLRRCEFFDFICMREPDENAVRNYQTEIFTVLETFQSGLKATIMKKKDVIFNIICVWNYIRKWKKYVPQQYIKNSSDFIIPLDTCMSFISSYSGSYFATKLSSLYYTTDSLSNKILKAMLDFGMLAATYSPIMEGCKILCSGAQFEDPYEAFFFTISLFPATDVFNVFKEYINEVIMFFLPVWPYYELLPQILDFSFKENLGLNYVLVLDCILHLIMCENQSQYIVKKNFYLQLFDKVWYKGSEKDILAFFVDKICILVGLEFSHPIVIKLMHYNKSMKKRNMQLIEVIAINSTKMSDGKKMEFVKTVVMGFKDSLVNYKAYWGFISFFKNFARTNLIQYQGCYNFKLMHKILRRSKFFGHKGNFLSKCK